MKSFLSLSALLALGLVGCSESKEDEDEAVVFTVTVENVSGANELAESGVFNTPADADEPGPLLPGSEYVFEFSAGPGQRLSFATMFVQSNDWFVATAEEGFELFDDEGEPHLGDIARELLVLDSGTEADETPGEGENQAPRQDGPDSGPSDPDDEVRLVSLDAEDYVSANLEMMGEHEFRLTLLNISDSSDIETPFAPGVYAIHTSGMPLFELGEPDAQEGLEALAEDGDPSGLADILSERTGLQTPFAPGVYVAHAGENPIFARGEVDFGEGLEALAEDGDPSALADSLSGYESSGAFNTPEGEDEPGPLFPGQSYSFSVQARPGEMLSFATMVVQSNDYFVGARESGFELFEDGEPVEGNIPLYVYDGGTEVDQPLGLGSDQAPRQSGPDTGKSEDEAVERVSLEADSLVRVTLEVAE